MNKIIVFLVILIIPKAYASTYEISTPGNNIGIGTTSVANPLTVNGTVQATTFIAGTGLATVAGNGTNVGIGTTTPLSPLSINGGVSIGTENNSAVSAPTNGLLVSGNVGIATINPGTALDVNGSVRMTGFVDTTSPTSGYVMTASANGTGTWQVASGGTSTSGTLLLFGNGSGGFTNVTNTSVSGGNVGIGTVTPTALVTLGSTGQSIITSAGNVGIGTALAGAPLVVSGSGSIAATFPGNVGINSTNPGQALDVNGTVRMTTLGTTLSVASGTNGCLGQATLSSGTVTVSTTCTPATSLGIFLTDAQTSLTNVGSVTIATVTTGTSFVVQSTNILDASKVNWWIEKTS